MLKSLLKAQAARRGAKALPGGWITVLALHPRSRQMGTALAKRGWREVQRRRGR